MKKGFYLTVNSKMLAILFSSVFTVILIILALTANSIVAVNGNNTNSLPVVIIDAGHGGEDGGTQSSVGVLEKDINLKIAHKLNNILTKYGFKTIMIREDDRMIYEKDSNTVKQRKTSDLHNRMAIMKDNPGCLFISIHQNHFAQSKYSGAQVFYCKTQDGSAELAGYIQDSIVSDLQKENKRAIKPCDSNVYLIYNAVSTAVMIECGFLSNPLEAKKLSDDTYQEEMASAISKGILNYLKNKGS